MKPDSFQPTPWDTSTFGINCFVISEISDGALSYASSIPGHYTVKVDPLASKELLHRHGFYYTDTLIEPFCSAESFISHPHDETSIRNDVTLEQILSMCDNTFLHGRFHRDFNISPAQADQRYKQWLSQLYSDGGIIGLYYQEELTGFIAQNNGALLLHAISQQFRGSGLAKFLWSSAIQDLFKRGTTEITSSISVSNMAVLNLYVSLGFRFRNAQDVYHRLTTDHSS